MDVSKYLKRIKFDGAINVDRATLEALHHCHVSHVPFENLDIYFRKVFDLKIENIYKKVVANNRGGFCYELNLLFNELLCSLGFQSRIIEARIITDKGELGPRFDHMSVLVEADKSYIADVGFGDLFLRPLEIVDGVQSDGRNLFKMDQLDEFRYLLSMAKDDRSFEKKYVFDLRPAFIEDFYAICLDKQTSNESYFVKNLICTRPTDTGRVTFFNQSMIERRGDERIVTRISNDRELVTKLEEHFAIVIS
jgi:N-hydroxyarylamine O-acetyltransferase